MLDIFVFPTEQWDEQKEEFVPGLDGGLIQLEHSLVSVSKWEAKWKKPYLGRSEKTPEEFLDYIRCMTLTPNVSPGLYTRLTKKDINKIVNYINDPMTATTFSDDKKWQRGRRNELITSEVIYYWMAQFGIPFSCETWHLNRLLTLIRVCNVKNSPKKKKSNDQILREYSSINERNKKLFGTKG